MNSKSGECVDSAIEELCSQGCEEVQTTIHKLENNQSVMAVNRLSSADKATVLEELKSIMAVYQQST